MTIPPDVCCPFCHQELSMFGYCMADKITYWNVDDFTRFRLTNDTGQRENFMKQHPGEPGYWLSTHNKFYNKSEMERLAKLKAFL